MQQCTEGLAVSGCLQHTAIVVRLPSAVTSRCKSLLKGGRRPALVWPASCSAWPIWPSSWIRTCILPQGIKTADWSEEVAPFWGAVIRSALSAEGFSGLFKAGWTTIKARRAGACALYHESAFAAWFCMCILYDAGSCLTSGEALLVYRVHW